MKFTTHERVTLYDDADAFVYLDIDIEADVITRDEKQALDALHRIEDAISREGQALQDELDTDGRVKTDE